jgi:DNA-binding response OmpR family regulator
MLRRGIPVKAVRAAKIIVTENLHGAHPMIRALAHAGFTVVPAQTGTKTLALADTDIDAAVLDINLPDVNGFEVCRQLNARSATAHIAVVFISSTHDIAEAELIASRLGAVAYLTKPVELHDLVNVINLAISKKDLEAQRSGRRAQSA